MFGIFVFEINMPMIEINIPDAKIKILTILLNIFLKKMSPKFGHFAKRVILSSDTRVANGSQPCGTYHDERLDWSDAIPTS